MKLSKYLNIVRDIEADKTSIDCLSNLQSKHPEVDKCTLLSILDQEFQRKMKRTYRRHTTAEKMNEHYFRYCENSQQNVCKHVILSMAQQEELSPCLLGRIILERHLAFTKYEGSSASKAEVNQLMKEPWRIEDPILASEINLCVASDILYGPISNTRKQSVGHEYEVILEQKLTEAALPYQNEKHLRSRGFDKTPDIVLQIPIAVGDSIVAWIESKASFGDRESHEGYLNDQYWSYQNRFGPGLVIYWHGFIEELNVDKNSGIILRDSFPEHFEVINISE